jgi:hypothetical protein
MELIRLKLKEKGDEKQRQHANFTKAPSVSLSLQLPSRILYVYRRTDCVACQAVCRRQRWSLYQAYQTFSVVLKTKRSDDSLYLYFFYYKAFLFTFFVYPRSDERYKISSYGCRYKPCRQDQRLYSDLCLLRKRVMESRFWFEIENSWT